MGMTKTQRELFESFMVCDEFAYSKDINSNVKTTKCIHFIPKWLYGLKGRIFSIKGKLLNNINDHNYPGVLMFRNYTNDVTMKVQMKGFYARGYVLIRYSQMCTLEVNKSVISVKLHWLVSL